MDIWARYENILEQIRQIEEILKYTNEHPPCCLKIHGDGSWECSRYHLEAKEFKKKCQECQKEILSKLPKIE